MSTIYQKYRPKTFSEISGQSHIVRTLTNAILNNRIGHAYLLTGPRGTGKTTLARIFAKTINCLEPVKESKKQIKAGVEPCNKCNNCRLILENKAIDLVEIDAASHTGVDNIRQLRESIPLPPTTLKYKVYIIDEVHMLSMGAFNALLKTLEEPPAHAIFVLATTELHKIPETIISRCQRFDVTNLSIEQIIERLQQIAKAEQVEIEQEALETIALEAEGGMRDAESLFGQILSLQDKKITAQETHEILGTSSRRLVIEFVHALLEAKTKECLEKIDQLENDGINLKNFNKLLLVYLRNLLLLKANPKTNASLLNSLSKEQLEKAKTQIIDVELRKIILLIELFQKSLSVFKESTIPQLPLELAVIEFSLSDGFCEELISSNVSASDSTEAKNDLPGEKIEIPPATKIQSQKTQTQSINDDSPKKMDLNSDDNNLLPFNKNLEEVLDHWTEILEKVKPHNHSISAFLKNCIPCGIKQDTIYIKTKYDFYKDKLSEVNNRLTVQKVIATIMNTSAKVAFVTENEFETMNFEITKNSGKDHNVLHDAMQVFGGRIVK